MRFRESAHRPFVAFALKCWKRWWKRKLSKTVSKVEKFGNASFSVRAGANASFWQRISTWTEEYEAMQTIGESASKSIMVVSKKTGHWDRWNDTKALVWKEIFWVNLREFAWIFFNSFSLDELVIFAIIHTFVNSGLSWQPSWCNMMSVMARVLKLYPA